MAVTAEERGAELNKKRVGVYAKGKENTAIPHKSEVVAEPVHPEEILVDKPALGMSARFGLGCRPRDTREWLYAVPLPRVEAQSDKQQAA